MEAHLKELGGGAFDFSQVKKVTVLSPNVNFSTYRDTSTSAIPFESDLMFYGYKNSTTELVAKDNRNKFISIGTVKKGSYQTIDEYYFEAYDKDYYPKLSTKKATIKEKTLVIPTGTIEITDEMIPESAKTATSVQIPNTVKFIRNNAFNKAHKLKAVTVPSSVIYIGNNALNNCVVKNIEILNPNAYIGTNLASYYYYPNDYEQLHNKITITG